MAPHFEGLLAGQNRWFVENPVGNSDLSDVVKKGPPPDRLQSPLIGEAQLPAQPDGHFRDPLAVVLGLHIPQADRRRIAMTDWSYSGNETRKRRFMVRSTDSTNCDRFIGSVRHSSAPAFRNSKASSSFPANPVTMKGMSGCREHSRPSRDRPVPENWTN